MTRPIRVPRDAQRRATRRLQHHLRTLATPGTTITVDSAAVQAIAPSPAVLAVLALRDGERWPTFRAREIAPSQVLASTEGDGCAWAWLYSVSADGTPWLRHFEGAAKSRAVAEAAVLARMGR